MKHVILSIAISLAACTSSARGFTTITDGHVDVISIGYSAQAGLVGRVHAGNGTLDPAQTLLYDGPPGTTGFSRPGGSKWSFLGVGPGETVHVWPQTSTPGRIFAGFEAEEVKTGTFASYLPDDPRIATAARWLRVELVDMRFFDSTGVPADAEFSLWQIESVGGDPLVWMSTADGITEADVFYLTEGGHAHVNWGFSAAGYYQIDLRISGYLDDGFMTPVGSAVTTWHFGVEFVPVAIPEPAPVCLALAGIVLLLARFGIFPKPTTKP